MVFIQRTVEIVGATLRDERNLRARRTALVRIVAGGRHSEFLHGIDGNWQYRSECVAVHLIVRVHAVQRQVALVAARAVHRSAAGVHIPVDIASIAGVDNSGLQRQKLGYASSFER